MEDGGWVEHKWIVGGGWVERGSLQHNSKRFEAINLKLVDTFLGSGKMPFHSETTNLKFVTEFRHDAYTF